MKINSYMNTNENLTVNCLQGSVRDSSLGANKFINTYVSNIGEDEQYDASINFSRFPNASYMKMSVFKPSASAKNTNQLTTSEINKRKYSDKTTNGYYNNHGSEFHNNDDNNKSYEGNDNDDDDDNLNHKFVKQKLQRVWQEKYCGKC